MLHDLVFQDVSGNIANHLVNMHHGMAGVIVLHAHRLDVGIQNPPLTPPVGTHFLVSMHAAPFHPVRPVHIRAHPGQNPIDVASVKCAIDGCQ